MSPTLTSPLPSAKSSAGYFILAGSLLFLGFCAIGVVGIFQLGSEATVLREAVMGSVPGQWDKKIALRVGWVTTALVRGGSRFFHLPPEPRAALDALHGAEVGVYNLREEPGNIERGAILNHMDKAMTGHGWQRVVGVVEERQLVAVYMPQKGVSERRMKCCVAVLNDRDLVVVSARGNLEPLLAIAREHMDKELHGHLFAWR